jgi:hypothetical protein
MFPVLCVEVAGEDAELGNGVEIRNDRRSRIHVFFRVAAVYNECIREFPLAVDRDRSGVQTSGRRERTDANVLLRVGGERSSGNNTRLEGEQIGVTPAIEGHRRHLRARDDFAHLCVGGLRVNRGLGHRNCLRLFANFQNGVNSKSAVGIDGDTGPLVWPEARLLDRNGVAPNGKFGKGVEPLVVRRNLLRYTCVGICGFYGCVRNCAIACISHGARNTPASPGPRIDGTTNGYCESKKQGDATKPAQDRGKTEDTTLPGTSHSAFLLV